MAFLNWIIDWYMKKLWKGKSLIGFIIALIILGFVMLVLMVFQMRFKGMLEILILLGVGVFMFFNGFSTFSEKKMIEAVPTTAIEGIAMGLTEIVGKVVSFPKEKLMTSPISRKKCVYWNVVAQELRERGSRKHGTTEWVTVYDVKKSVKFYLKDKTAQVLVNPEGARVDLKPDKRLYGRRGIGVEAITKLGKKLFGVENVLGMKKGAGKKVTNIREIDRYLRGYPKAKRPSFRNFEVKEPEAALTFISTGDRQYFEYVIEPGDNLYILGTAGDNPYVEETTALKAVKDIMVQKGKLEKLYIISDKSEKEILKKYGWGVWFQIISGAAAMLVSVTIIGMQLL